MKPIVIFDLDGVFVHTPTGETINDLEYWDSHWNHPEKALPHLEMVDLARMLVDRGTAVIVLTARPRKYQSVTERVLSRFGLSPITVEPEQVPEIIKAEDPSLPLYPMLVMIPADEIVPSSIWKSDVVRSWLDEGMNIKFMVEDYKPNAEAVREHIPVLLYERVKLV